MTGSEFRRLMRERHTLVDPGPYFIDRVIARLPREEGRMLAWAARRVLPVSLALAAVLTVAVLATNRTAGRPSNAPAVSSSSHHETDVLDWLLENDRKVQ